MDDQDRILRQIVGSYNPEDALRLPLREKINIVQELTGYRPSDEKVIDEYLRTQELGVLVQDAGIAALLRTQLQEKGYHLSLDENLREYTNTSNPAILARQEGNWEQLEKDYPETFQNLLLQAGTIEALTEFEEMAERDPTEAEARVAYFAAAQTGDFDVIRHLAQYEYHIMIEDEEEDSALLLQLTSQQVRNLVTYDQEEGDDATVNFLFLYYQADSVEQALFYLSLWSIKERTAQMSLLPSWGNLYFNVQKPVIQAYLETFPDDLVTQEIMEGGSIALNQIAFPDPDSMYSSERGSSYIAEQDYMSKLLQPGLPAREVEAARREVETYPHSAAWTALYLAEE